MNPNSDIRNAVGTHHSWVDQARVLAAILVVLVHVCTGPFENPDPGVHHTTWYLTAFIASASRVCVPMFFMLAGFLTFRPDIEPITFWKRRLPRLLIPLVSWSLIYIVWRQVWHGNQISLASAIRLILTGEVYYHLWFLYSLVGIYLTLPFLTKLADSDQQRLLFSATIIWLANAVVLPAIGNAATIWSGKNCNLAVPIPTFTGFVGYIFLGVQIGRIEPSKQRRIQASVVFAIAILLTFLLTVIASTEQNAGTQSYFGYLFPTTVLASAALVVFFRSLERKCSPVFIQRLASLTPGVYLIHPLILDVLAYSVPNESTRSFMWIPFASSIAIAISFLLVNSIATVPYVRRIVGS